MASIRPFPAGRGPARVRTSGLQDGPSRSAPRSIKPSGVGILASGTVEERVIVEDGEVMIAPRMKMAMSCDHRVIDGATGTRFLQTLQGFLEEPVLIQV